MQRCCSWRRDASIRPGAWAAALGVLLLAASVLAVGRDVLHEMFAQTRSIGWTTPAGSTSLVAARHAAESFPGRMRGAIVMAVEAQDGTPSVLTDAVREFSQNVSDRVALDRRIQPFEPVVVGYFLDAPGGHALDRLTRAELVSPDQRMTVLVIQPSKTQGRWSDANSFLQEFCACPPPGFTLHITGMPAVLSGDGCFAGMHAKVNTRDMNFEVLFRAEFCTIPLALVVIGYIVHYLRLLLLPVFTLIISFVIAAAMMLPWMDVVPVASDVPAAMGSVTMALCLDYGLFFLSRFAEHHAEGMSLQKNIDTLLRCTGKTITVSGTLIAIAFFGSMVLPEENLKSTGMCMAFASMACVMTSLAFTPAVLLVAGNLATGSTFTHPWSGDVEMHCLKACQEFDGVIDPVKQRRMELEASRWKRAMRMVVRSPVSAVALVLLAMLPIFWHLPLLNISGDRFALMPMNMPAMQALRRVQQSFPVGILDPYAIVITSPGGELPMSSEVKDGTEALGYQDLILMATNLGLNPEEAAATAAAVADIRAGRGMDAASLAAAAKDLGTTCVTFAASAAGGASAAARAQGASDARAMRAALRAANETGCAAPELKEAVAAAAAALHAEGGRAPEDAREAAKTEALSLGPSPTAAGELATAAPRWGRNPDVPQRSLAAAKAGAAAGLGKLHGRADAEALKDALHTLEVFDLSAADVAQVMQAAAGVLGRKGAAEADDLGKQVQTITVKQGANQYAAAVLAAAVAAVAQQRHVDASAGVAAPTADHAVDASVARGARTAGSASATRSRGLGEATRKRWPLVLGLVDAVTTLSTGGHGALLMPSGCAAMLELCDAVQEVGSVASMLGPTWALHRRLDWPALVAMHANATARRAYRPLLDSHLNGRRALLEVHTTFPSIGAGAADWVLAARGALAAWERTHPGYTAELSGGASEAADTRSKVLGAMWLYLSIIVSMIMVVVFLTYRSVMVPVRLGLALIFTLCATYGVAVIVYQTPLLHGFFPSLAPFHGLAFEVVPMVTGVAIALGLDYDILLVSRIVEFRLQGFSDRASIFRGATKAGGVISGAGLIMVLAFSGLCFSDKLLMQQFGVLLITSVLLDTFVVRTVVVPALMLVARDWNWWPRRMPPGIYDVLEGDVADEALGLSSPMLGGAR